MSDLSKRLRGAVEGLDMPGLEAFRADLLAAADDVDRLDKLERQGGPVALLGTHLQRDGSYQTWQWRNVHGRETLRRRTVRECIDDIKEVL